MGYTASFGTPAITAPSVGLGSLIWTIVSVIIAIVGAFVIYFMFVSNKKFQTSNKFVAWLVDFLRFDKMLIETILKICYIFVAIFITLGSFALIPANFFAFLGMLICGNIIARVIYEAALIKIMIWKNTNEIKKNLK